MQPARPPHGPSTPETGGAAPPHELAHHVRDALGHLDDPVYLQTHPLGAALAPVPGASPAVAAHALRQRLLDAIAALHPSPAAGPPSSAWRRYQILNLRYVEGLEIAAVERRLAVSSGTYFRELQRAVDAVASLLWQQAHAPGEASAPPDASAAPPAPGPPAWEAASPDLQSARVDRLPLPLTTFVGREREVEEVRRLLTDGARPHRLLTLTGPPGTGKSRLALEAAAGLVGAFDDGVVYVPLAAVPEPSFVLPSISQALGVREVPGHSLLENLEEALRDRSLLLLLDNFEHVLRAAVLVVALLAAAPRLSVLVTSRAALRVRGEHIFDVPPLALPQPPGPGDAPAPDAVLARSEAVQLFLDRAQEVQPGLELTGADLAAAAEICRRLDGLPLAIELAAARTRLLPPAALLARLDRRLPLLTGGAQDMPAHQQTLRSAIAWSYDLLDAGERALFRRLSVFVGGCTLETAQAVLADSPAHDLAADAASAAPILDGMTSLVAQSLLRRLSGAGAEPRFRLFESIREFALEQLEAHGESEAYHRRHASYFLDLAEAYSRSSRTADEAARRAMLERLEAEHDNVRGALAWLEKLGQTEQYARLAGALAWFWRDRAYWTEGRRWLGRALALPGAASLAAPRARVLHGAGILAFEQGDLALAQTLLDEAVATWRDLDDKQSLAVGLGDLARLVGKHRVAATRPILAESLALSRELGDQRGIATALAELGFLAMCEGDHGAARALLAEGLEIREQLGDQRGAGTTRHLMGVLALMQGDYQAARAQFERSRRILIDAADRQGLAATLNRLGELAALEGDLAAAERLHHEAMSLARQLRDKDVLAWSLKDLGRVARRRGNERQAVELFRESLVLRGEQGHAWGIAMCLFELGESAARLGHAERAALLFAAAESIRESSGALPSAGDPSGYDPADASRHTEMLRARLSEGQFARAWAAGEQLTTQGAIADALAGF